MVDLLVAGRDVLTMNARREIVRDGAVAVSGGRVAEVGKAADLRRRYPDARVLGDADAVVTPGFINAHQHLTADRLLRSAIPDNVASDTAIFGWAVPAHAAVTERDDEISAIASALEQVGNGVTTVVEAGTVAHPIAVARGIELVGLRGCVGGWGWDAPGAPFAAPAAEVLARQRASVAALAAFANIEGWITLVGHDLVSDELFTGAADLARELDTRLSFHISPHAGDVEAYLARTGARPLVHLERIGILSDRTVLGHAVHLDDAEAAIVLRTRAAIAYTPWAYLRLGQGVARHTRHADLALAGARIALGCDAENAGDALDPLRVAALCAGLAKDRDCDPTRFGAHEAFELLTIRGAEAIGLGAEIGSLEAGKRADLVVFDTSGSEWHPRSDDPVLQLVWASDGRAVRDVIVGGEIVVRDRRPTRVDAAAVRAELASRSRALIERAGLAPRARWPTV